MTRNLFRLAAVVDEKNLHAMLVLLANAKAMNVEVHPVTGDMPRPRDVDLRPAGFVARKGNMPHFVFVRLYAAEHDKFTTMELVAAAPEGIERKQIESATMAMVKTGELNRAGRATFKRGKLKPIANGHDAPAREIVAASNALVRGSKPKRMGRGVGAAILLDVLRKATSPMKFSEVRDAVAAQGIPEKSVGGMIDRAVKAKTLKRSADGYSLKGEAA